MRADKQKLMPLLKTARGQIEGIIKMMDEDRYCMEISNQLQATESILHKINKEVLRAHMTGCVKEAFEAGNEDEKIDELLSLMDKMSR
jgi:DNA-binding FrmR family transcriptional regulator